MQNRYIHQHVIQNRIQNDIIADENILAAYYVGSLGAEQQNNDSTINLRIVVDKKFHPLFIKQKQQRAQMWGNVLSFEDVGESRPYTIVHYDGFIKLDIFYYTPEQIHPSVWLQNIHIIKDTNNIIHNLSRESMNVTYKPSEKEISYWRGNFFSYAHETYLKISKNETYYASSCLESLSWLVTKGWYMERNLIPNAQHQINSLLTNEQLELLTQWHSPKSKEQLTNTLKSISDEFLKIHHRLCVKTKLNENREWCMSILEMVL